jgi:AcrR family transcriptional regulator
MRGTPWQNEKRLESDGRAAIKSRMKAAVKKDATTPRKELVREEFLTKAADVFEKKGFASTTIQDVAQALQLSRSALYHYFKSKDEILEALVLEHTEYAAEQMEQKFATRNGSASDQLRELLANSINGRMTGGARLRVLDQLAAEMPSEIKQKFDHGRRRVLDLYTRLIQKGIDAGEFRLLDARTAAFAILGIASWTSWWYSPTGRKSPEELASVLVDIAFNGIARSEGSAERPQKPKEVLRALKRDVAELERLIQGFDDA